MNEKKISVIIPVYNVEQYLRRCIESVINQSYGNLEIILIDDGSTDSSKEICDYYSKLDNRIKVIHKSNGGQADARNVGIDIAEGSMIAFVDSDDYILPDYFSYLYQLLSVNKADISVCQYIDVDEDDKKISDGGKTVDLVIKGNDKCMEMFVKTKAIDTTPWRKLFQKHLFSADMRFPIGKYHEDVYLLYRIIGECQKIAIGSKHLYAYRKRNGSTINSKFSPKHMDYIDASIERYNFIASKYPELESVALRALIFALNSVVMRIAKSHTSPAPYLKHLQSLYRTYTKNYLKTDGKLMTKVYTIIANVNVGWLIKMLSFIK